jgi:transposase
LSQLSGMGRTKARKKSTSKRSPGPQRRVVTVQELEAALGRIREVVPENEFQAIEKDFQILKEVTGTLAFLIQELERKGMSLAKLRWWLFGTTEKTSSICPEAAAGSTPESDPAVKEEGVGREGQAAEAEAEPEAAANAAKDGAGKPRRKGEAHGRNGAADYPGAERTRVALEGVESGTPCKRCTRGKMYPLPDPKVIIRITAMAPFRATITELERWRCNLCNLILTATPPAGLGEEKYDETVPAMIATFRYGAGLPFNRIEHVQHHFEVPLPRSTQWELVGDAFDLVAPAVDELVRQAAQGDLLHNDDTPMRILDLPPMTVEDENGKDVPEGRKGIRTSGIVSRIGGRTIALYFSGHQHAGDNLAEVLARRAENLPTPIQMSDSLSHNTTGVEGTLVSYCLVHARRKFIEVEKSFPTQVRHLLEALREVYHFESLAKEQGLSPTERLQFHQENSKPVMVALHAWLKDQIDSKKTEPNCGLGKAIRHMLKHWERLTVFLNTEKAAIDNNLCEQILKRAILHRKNSLFYRNLTGAEVGDGYMSLIATAELNGANPFDYLVQLQRHTDKVASSPEEWMPWNYLETLARLEAEAAPAR